MMRYSIEEQREHRRVWCDALRSGKYRQGKICLIRWDKRTIFGITIGKPFARHCVLGVAAAIAGVDHNEMRKLQGVLSQKIMDYYGLANEIGDYRVNGNKRCLAYDNDKLLLSFRQMADIIESEPEEMFIQPNEEDEWKLPSVVDIEEPVAAGHI